MRLRAKIASGVLLLAAGAVAALSFAVSYESPCATAPPLLAGTPTMKALVHRCYGSPDVLELEDVSKPVPTDDEVLVRVRAVSVNWVDWHGLRGEPYVMRFGSGLGMPKNVRLGGDFAGTVEAVGKNVTRFRPGDDVFGGAGRGNAFADYVSVLANRTIARKPKDLTFEQAAAVPVAAITALQALRDTGRIRAGQKVLINGASGGVGTFAVQIAKAFGAEVTAVCSTRNLELVRSIGADHVVDYTREDVTLRAERYDLILDTVGTHSIAAYRRVLEPDGSYVVVGSAADGAWVGKLAALFAPLMYGPFVSQDLDLLLAKLKPEDLSTLRELLEAGKVVPVIDRSHSFVGWGAIADALRYLEAGHARGKVVVNLEHGAERGSVAHVSTR